MARSFRTIIRQEGSWKDSWALQSARQFKGKALVIVGTNDEVIPRPVIEAIVDNLHAGSRQVQLQTVPGVDHQLMQWLAVQPEQRKDIVRYLS